jgi:hypothetical protein
VELGELQKQQAAESTALETGEEIDKEEVLSEEELKKRAQAEKEQRLTEMKRKAEIAKVAMEEELKQVLCVCVCVCLSVCLYVLSTRVQCVYQFDGGWRRSPCRSLLLQVF